MYNGAFAEAGDVDKAVEYKKKSLTFPKSVKKSVADARSKLKLLSEMKPYRDPALVAPNAPEFAPTEVKGQ